MNYSDYERHLSEPRLNKYKSACGGDERKVLALYMLNIEISKKFYGILSLFEVALRNAINEHYRNHFSDDDWISNQANSGFFAEPKKESIFKEKKKLLTMKSYSSDRLVAVLSFGLWIDMFSSHCFNKGNQTLLKIFPDRQKGVNQKFIYKELNEIRIFRNRIAHHEAICFDKQGQISAVYTKNIWELIQKYTYFLGLPSDFLQNLVSPISSIRELDNFSR
jgi:hypothetical protein